MAEPIATLSMYDWPETRASLERFWNLIAEELRHTDLPTPGILHHVEDQMPLWTSPELVIGQTCGWPYVNSLRDSVVPFARFDYGLDGCPPGTYRSVYIGQNASDSRYLEDAQTLQTCPSVAINGDDSQSGFHVFSEISGKPTTLAIAEQQRVLTRAHRNSVKAVANGDAQIAAIDAVAFELAKRFENAAVNAVQILGHSIPKPGLPLITSNRHAESKDQLFDAVSNAHAKLSKSDLDTLLIKEVLPAHDSDYDIFLASR